MLTSAKFKFSKKLIRSEERVYSHIEKRQFIRLAIVYSAFYKKKLLATEFSALFNPLDDQGNVRIIAAIYRAESLLALAEKTIASLSTDDSFTKQVMEEQQYTIKYVRKWLVELQEKNMYFVDDGSAKIVLKKLSSIPSEKVLKKVLFHSEKIHRYNKLKQWVTDDAINESINQIIIFRELIISEHRKYFSVKQ